MMEQIRVWLPVVVVIIGLGLMVCILMLIRRLAD